MIQLQRRNTLSIINGPEGLARGKDGRLSPEPVLGRLGQASSPDVSPPVCHLRTPSPVRHLRMPIILTSKLSCNACPRFIEASNKCSNWKFHTRGCHGKWYFPWGFPPSDQQVSSAFEESMSRYIVEVLLIEGVARSRRNSNRYWTDVEGLPQNRETYKANKARARKMFESRSKRNFLGL